MNLRLLYHGHCFDGVASAALFTRFYLSRNPSAHITYAALAHRAGDLFETENFGGDENAIVDFKYAASDRLTWWFDHHQSAFLSPEDEAHFRADTSGQKFWDAESKSCTEFIERVAREQFNFHEPAFAELVRWAHVIDGAFYDSPAQPVELREPALRLMQVIETSPDDEFNESLIRQLAGGRTLEEVAAGEDVHQRFEPVYEQHLKTVELIRRKAFYARGVINFDLVEEGLKGFNKFIPYYVRPETTYSVAVTSEQTRAKISVGSNPFSPRPRLHNIATICERYGGGGHPVVGAVSFPPEQIEEARRVAVEIIEELSQGFVE